MSNMKFNRTYKGIVIVPSSTVLDKSLSLGALGALTLLLSAKDDPELFDEKLEIVGAEFDSVLSELQMTGYVRLEDDEGQDELRFNIDGSKLEEDNNE